MQFNTGNPSLVDLARLYAGDPSGSAQSTWTEQQVKDQVNIVYDELLNICRRLSEGWQEKISYMDAVADQIYYALPSGFLHLVLAELSGNGSDLSSTAPSSSDVTVLDPVDSDTALRAYDQDNLTDTKFIFPQGSNYGILAPPAAVNVGTNSIKLVYEASSTQLSADSDEPIFPREHHNAIAIGAAYYLKLSRDLPVQDVERRWELLRRDFKRSAKFRFRDLEMSVPQAGLLTSLSRLTRAGTVRKT